MSLAALMELHFAFGATGFYFIFPVGKKGFVNPHFFHCAGYDHIATFKLAVECRNIITCGDLNTVFGFLTDDEHFLAAMLTGVNHRTFDRYCLTHKTGGIIQKILNRYLNDLLRFVGLCLFFFYRSVVAGRK